MTTVTQEGKPIALVGSVPGNSASDVFNSVASKFGRSIKRIPDGETGIRSYWIARQARVFHENPAFEPVGHNWTPDKDMPTKPPTYRLKAGFDPKKLKISTFGYPQFARDSYSEFLELRASGALNPQARFQVCLPTPLSFYASLVDAGSSEAVAPAIEQEIYAEANDIIANIPAHDLAIQWDVCTEMFVWEGVRPIFFKNPREAIINRLVALGSLVPSNVELGYHFCYGDFQHKHTIEPTDMANMVSMANAIAGDLKREITWVHFPVPRDRSDAAYFAPLSDLRLSSKTEVYLGLVHHTDGVAGTKQRMAAAKAFLPDFGIATECGWGRRDKSTIADLIDIHNVCAKAL